MCVVDDRDKHFAGVVVTKGLFDQSTFALESGRLECDTKRLAEDLHRVGVGVQSPGDGGDQILLVGEPFKRLLDHRLAGSRRSHDETESALLAMDVQRVVDFLLMLQQFDVTERKGIVGQSKIGTDHGVGPH